MKKKYKKKLISNIYPLFISVGILFYSPSIISQKSKSDSASIYFKKADELNNINRHADAFNLYSKSLQLYSNKKDEDSIAICNLKIFKLLDGQNNLGYDPKPYLDAYYSYAQKSNDTLKSIIANYNYASYFFERNPALSAEYYHKTLFLGKKIGRKKTETSVYVNLALLYTKNEPDSASFFFQKALNSLNKDQPNQLISTYINYANFYQKKGEYNKAIIQLKKAEKITPTKYKLNLDRIIFKKFSELYEEIGAYEKAYAYLDKYNIVKDSINNTQQNIAISELNKKYKTAEKEKELLEEQQRSKERKNLLIAAFIFIILAGSIALLMLKNSRRKRLLAEQEKELESQKNLTLLKEQEINTINAMIEGQEKERKRVAEDLHDNLGSVLATLKLHFENLQINNKKQKVDQETLFNKTENLIDEAYLKVRSIAHAKNAGVIANKGLLVAVQLMASKISSANKTAIDVVHFGLDTPLDNSLEITVFRVIQELTTNILKHANASHATINLSRHENSLNIIVEDNGSGFDPNIIDSKTGMGIHSIKTRIAHIKGEFVIDSTPKKGTTIIINIPIE